MAPSMVYYDLASMFNTTSTTNSTFVRFLQYTSNPTNDPSFIFAYLPAFLIMFTVFFVLLMSLKLRNYDTLPALAVATIVNCIIAILFYPLGIINGAILIVSIFGIPVIGLLVFILAPDTN